MKKMGYFGYRPIEGEDDADMGRQHAEEFLELLRGEGFAKPNPRPMFPNPPGLLRLEPHSAGLCDRIWWGSASNATAEWAAKLGMNLQSSTLKFDETGEPLSIQQAARIRPFRAAWRRAGHTRTPRTSVSRSIFSLLDDRDRMYFGRGSREEEGKIGLPRRKHTSHLRPQLRRRAADSHRTASQRRGGRGSRHAVYGRSGIRRL